MPILLAAGLSPAWQQVMTFDSFAPGRVNRARDVRWCASGKVLNVARAVHHLGGAARAVTVRGGASGDAIRRDFDDLGIAARWVDGAVPTRVCTTILDRDRRTATELVPAAGAVSAGEQSAFLTAYREEAVHAGATVLIGSIPAGTPTDLYRRLAAVSLGPVIVDARGPELLECLSAKPFLVKPNREELSRTVGVDLSRDDQLLDAMGELNRLGARWVVVTDGDRPVLASGDRRRYRLVPPRVDVVNPIGCGDCLAAGIAWATLRGKDPLEAIRYGVAVAADKVTRPLPGEVDVERVARLERAVEVHPVSAAGDDRPG